MIAVVFMTVIKKNTLYCIVFRKTVLFTGKVTKIKSSLCLMKPHGMKTWGHEV